MTGSVLYRRVLASQANSASPTKTRNPPQRHSQAAGNMLMAAGTDRVLSGTLPLTGARLSAHRALRRRRGYAPGKAPGRVHGDGRERSRRDRRRKRSCASMFKVARGT